MAHFFQVLSLREKVRSYGGEVCWFAVNEVAISGIGIFEYYDVTFLDVRAIPSQNPHILNRLIDFQRQWAGRLEWATHEVRCEALYLLCPNGTQFSTSSCQL